MDINNPPKDETKPTLADFSNLNLKKGPITAGFNIQNKNTTEMKPKYNYHNLKTKEETKIMPKSRVYDSAFMNYDLYTKENNAENNIDELKSVNSNRDLNNILDSPSRRKNTGQNFITQNQVNNNNNFSKNTINTSVSESENFCSKQIGLDNLGNTCFMNTSLQCLLHTDLFISKFFKFQGKFDVHKLTPISKALYGLCQQIIKKESTYKMSISPADFKTVFGRSHKVFSGFAQQDSQEFLRKLLEDISIELNRVTHIPQYKELDTKINDKIKLNSDYDKLFKGREDSIIVDTFYGQYVNVFECVECQYETYSFEKFLDIPILLEEERLTGFKMHTLLKGFFQADKIKWESPCENKLCKKVSYHKKTQRLSFLPEVLILSFQRYNGRLRRKNSSKIEILETLNIEDYVEDDCVGK